MSKAAQRRLSAQQARAKQVNHPKREPTPVELAKEREMKRHTRRSQR